MLQSVTEAIKNNRQPPVNVLPSDLLIPLPIWKETKERIKSQLVANRATILLKSKEWQQKEQVCIDVFASACDV